jgi:hypothetical protein
MVQNCLKFLDFGHGEQIIFFKTWYLKQNYIYIYITKPEKGVQEKHVRSYTNSFFSALGKQGTRYLILIELQDRSYECTTFVGLAYQGKDLVFRFIIEYSSLRDFF